MTTQPAPLTPLAAAAALLAGLAGPAVGASFSAEADVVNSAGNPRASSSSSGSAPVTVTVGPVSSTDGRRSGQATGAALRGGVQGIGLSASTSGKVTSIGQGRATFDDVLFVFRGGGTGVLPQATLNYSLAAAQTLSGPALAGFNARDVTWSISFAGAGDGGFVDFQGGTGLGLLGGRQLTATNVPVGTPVTITMSVFAGAAATTAVFDQLVQSSINAVLQVGAAQAGASPQGARLGARSVDAEGTMAFAAAAAEPVFPRVFDLPDGVTVFSESMGIVDNRWVAAPVPEPSTWALWLAGAALLAGPLRRRARLAA